jgi:hypothetical protein
MYVCAKGTQLSKRPRLARIATVSKRSQPEARRLNMTSMAGASRSADCGRKGPSTRKKFATICALLMDDLESFDPYKPWQQVARNATMFVALWGWMVRPWLWVPRLFCR